MSKKNKGFGHSHKQKQTSNKLKPEQLLYTAINYHQQGKLEKAIAKLFRI